MEKIKIRKAKRSDIDAIVKLNSGLTDYHHKIDPKYWSPSSKTKGHFRKFITAEFGKRNALVLVAEDNGKIIGYFAGLIEKTHPRILPRQIGNMMNGYLLEGYRGQGIAKMSVKVVLEWFKKRGVKLVRLSVDSRNELGLRAWEGLGFKEFKKEMKLEI